MKIYAIGFISGLILSGIYNTFYNPKSELIRPKYAHTVIVEKNSTPYECIVNHPALAYKQKMTPHVRIVYKCGTEKLSAYYLDDYGKCVLDFKSNIE